jgi:hypothetical protein
MSFHIFDCFEASLAQGANRGVCVGFLMSARSLLDGRCKDGLGKENLLVFMSMCELSRAVRKLTRDEEAANGEA